VWAGKALPRARVRTEVRGRVPEDAAGRRTSSRPGGLPGSEAVLRGGSAVTRLANALGEAPPR